MARQSNPSSSNSRFNVWDAAGDLYSYEELAENWDTLDAIIGRPSSGADWPPLGERGVNGGLYKYIKLLEAERSPIGHVMYWWRPSASVPIPTGYEVIAGQVILAANHHFPGISADIRLPEARNAFPIGADPNKALGTAGTTSNAAAGAPGLTSNAGLGNVGAGGSNNITHSHTVPAHSHAIAGHSHTVDDHTHGMFHYHKTSDLEGGTPYYIGAAYKLASTAIEKFLEFERPGTFKEGPTVITGPIVPSWSHNHYAGFNAGSPRNALNIDEVKSETGSRAPGTSTNGGGSTGIVDAATTNNVELDNRPYHVAFIPLMKVRHATTL